MTDVDRMSPAEEQLRAELHRRIIPPPTPFRLGAHVEALASASLDERVARPGSLATLLVAGGRTLRLAMALAAVLALVAGALFVGSRIDRTPEVATPHPTLPAIVGPALPTPAANPTIVHEGGWIDADTAWLVDDANRLRITTDGAQTWSEPRDLDWTEAGLEFLDATHGYTTWAVEAGEGMQRVGNLSSLIAYRTSDGGVTWEAMQFGALGLDRSDVVLATVHFSDPSHGVALVATAPDGQVTFETCTGFVTDDGGTSWSEVPDAPCFYSLRWASPEMGLAVGSNDGSSVALTLDGGRTWQPSVLPGAGDGGEFWQLALVAAEDGRLRLAGSYHDDGAAGIPSLVVLETVDKGRTWGELFRTAVSEAGTIQWISTLDGTHWLGLLQLPAPERPFETTELVETWDGGRSWTSAGSTGTIRGAWMSWGDRLHGMLQGVDMGDCSDPSVSCGGLGTMFLTNDGGRSWHEVPF